MLFAGSRKEGKTARRRDQRQVVARPAAGPGHRGGGRAPCGDAGAGARRSSCHSAACTGGGACLRQASKNCRCAVRLRATTTAKNICPLRASRDRQGKARPRSQAFSICANCAEITSPRGFCRTDSRTACRSPWRGRHRARRALWPPRQSPRRQSWRNRSALRSPFRATSPR